MPRRVAIYGGSFNPPHNAHVAVAAYAASSPDFDAVWIIPTFQHVFDKSLAAFEHRLAMCQLAFGALPHTEVLDIERELGGPSPMVRTLRALRTRHPEAELRLVIGSDLIGELARWQEPAALQALAPPWMVQRGGSEHPGVSGPVFDPVSSTEVRSRLADGQSITDLVPAAVGEYIERHHLYRT